MMNGEQADRIAEGTEILEEQMTKVHDTAELFLGALKGFRRDLALSLQANSKYITADFEGMIQGIAVPILPNGASFSDLEQMLSLCENALDGTILIKDPRGYKHEERKKVIEEIAGIHKNLFAISDMSRELHDVINSACMEFDVFNTKNIEDGRPELNILFNRDSLNVSMSIARALGERAIRLDIDLMTRGNDLKEDE